MINTPKIYKMRIEFTVSGRPDHKRIFNVLRNAVLGSGLAFEPAKINKNWPRLAYGPVLGYAQESLGEYADIYLTQSASTQAVRQALAQAAGNSLTIKRVERVPYALPSVSNLAAAACYWLQGDFKHLSSGMGLAEFINAPRAVAVITAPNGMTREEDIKPYVLACEQPQADKIVLTLQTVEGKSLKPEYVVAAWLGITIMQGEEFTVENVKFIREGLYWRDTQGALHRI